MWHASNINGKLRLIQVGEAISYPVDPLAVFNPGQISQLKVINVTYCTDR